MPDMEKVKALTSLLEERSGLDVREALVRFTIICQSRRPEFSIKRQTICLTRSVLRLNCRSDSG